MSRFLLLAGLIGAGSVVLLGMVLHLKRGKIVKLNVCNNILYKMARDDPHKDSVVVVEW